MEQLTLLLANTTVFGLDPTNVTYDSVTQNIVEAFADSPYHWMIEASLVLFIGYLLFAASSAPATSPDKLTDREVERLVADWEPESLAGKLSEHERRSIERVPVVSSDPGQNIVVNGTKCLNFGTTSFLGASGEKTHKDIAVETLKKYGCGTCGPRGFYGTIDKHLDLERRVAEFFGVEESILYPYGFATISSAIPAFAKRGDILLVDKAVSFATQTGVMLSRSKVYWYEHNSMQDLERLMMKVEKQQAGQPLERRFVITEGIFANNGNICPLDELVKLKNQYKWRVILEESSSIGVLGKHGRGVVEHFGIERSEILFSCASLAGSFGSIGGLCFGSHEVVDHQRLSGSGYCFSASLPTMLATFAVSALDDLEKKPAVLAKLAANAKHLHDALRSVPGTIVSGSDCAPFAHVTLQKSTGSIENDEDALDRVVEEARDRGVAVVRMRYVRSQETFVPTPTIRVCVSASHSKANINKAVDAIAAAFGIVQRALKSKK